MLEIQNFLKKYPTGFQLEIDSLLLKEGVHTIQGENGAGKSTLFKAIAGIHTFQGKIILEKADLKKDPLTYRKSVNYAEAEPTYPEFLTLNDLILFVAKAKQATNDQIEHLISVFGVSAFLAQPIATYSSGMLKKTSLLLAFLGNPRLIILDEPFTTIDRKSQENLIDLIKLQMAKGVNFLISSHQTAILDLMDFDSVHSISKGRIHLGK
jgi:ABC-2 type transport system ATP-binding protein